MNVLKMAMSFFIVALAPAAFCQSAALTELLVQSRGAIDPGGNSATIETGALVGFTAIANERVRVGMRAALALPDTEGFFWRADGEREAGFILFEGANITIVDGPDSAASLTAFTGYLDNPASSSLLRSHLKTDLEPSEFHGMPAGMPFAPQTEIRGTGIASIVDSPSAGAAGAFYGYWNERTGDDAAYSLDARIAADGSFAAVNAFLGAALRPRGNDWAIRGGATALFRSSQGSGLYVEAGTKAQTADPDEVAKSLYFLFEPRFSAGLFDFALSFFSAPVAADDNESAIAAEYEGSFLGFNALIAAGRMKEHGFRAGLSLLGCVDPDDPGTVSPLTFSVTPFASMMLSDYEASLAAVIKPLNVDHPSKAGELRVTIKAVY